jgi:aspartate/methionine/tyrosine aminotransferase
VSYVELVRIAGRTPVEVPPGPQCRPELAALANAVTPRTRGVILNTPSNPTGYVWTRAEIAGLARLARERDLWILSDEIYRRLVYEGEPFRSPVEEGDDARRRTVIVDGASKSFAMTGYRVGFLAAERGIADAVARLHSQMTGSPNTVSQAAYEAALQREPPEVAEMVREYGARRRLLLAGLVALGLECPEPRGAFYAFPNVSRYLDERGSAGFCSDCLESKGLSLVPGAAFGLDAHVRLSYALAPERLHEALERLGAFLESHVAR